MQGMG
jgi:hypothetical protein